MARRAGPSAASGTFLRTKTFAAANNSEQTFRSTTWTTASAGLPSGLSQTE